MSNDTLKHSKLNQIIAVEKGVKNQSMREITDVHHKLQKSDLLSGLSRTYRPKDDDGEVFPPESKSVQIHADDLINDVNTSLTRLFDVVATKDWANCKARANVIVDGVILLTDVPATYLLFLEKQLTDLHTFIEKLPILDASEKWTHSVSNNAWATDAVQTTKTKKIPRNHVKAEATDKHPAQVEVFVGYWTIIKYSGALPAARVHQLLERVIKLQEAVKFAREEANGSDAPNVKAGASILNWLFA